MVTWIVISNNRYFDLEKLIYERSIVDWVQKRYKYEVGDTVYFYTAAPKSRIICKGVIIAKDLKESELIDDSEYEKKREAYLKGNKKLIRIRILAISESSELSRKNLMKHGYSGAVQGSSKNIPAELIEYIEQRMDLIGSYPDSDETEEAIFEGAVTRVTVNSYERNPRARQECIDYYGGYKCQICGMDFGKTYGSYASKFIHVHHLKPISEIGEKYMVIPEKDLIPVCPNCHAMLHLKHEDGSRSSVQELKKLFKT